jgi:hypothetical protein
MTTLSASSSSTDRVEAVYNVFKDAAHPLTLTQAHKLCSAGKPAKPEFSRIVEDQLLMQGRVFRCSPSGNHPRYWVYDEEEKVRTAVEELLAMGPMAEGNLVTAVNKALPKVSSKTAIERFVAAMREQGLLHVWPKGRTKRLALQPFDATTLIVFNKKTLENMSAVLAKVEPLGVSLNRFLQTLGYMLRPDGIALPAAEGQAATPSVGSVAAGPPHQPEADGPSERGSPIPASRMGRAAAMAWPS